jgi:hypothetical protein
MKMKTFTKLAGAAFLAAMSISAFAQNDLGVSCGCPAVSARTTVVNLSTLVVNGTTNPELTGNTHLTCDKIWVLDQKVYVPNGVTLTIDPGTVIKGASAVDPLLASALIVERGGKIIADGTSSCPIVFTAADDDMSGSYSLTNVGKWGGVVILGIASNNLNFALNGPTKGTCITGDGIGFIEGFNAANSWNHYGAGPADVNFPTPNDNDNSGIFRYVSVRHAGALIVNGNELNGISLGSVGRGTKFEHVEVVAAADDNIEAFGGTVNLKYCSTLFGDDDMLDWDQGFSGKVQFYFAMACDSILRPGTNLATTDNGFESDADDQSAATATSNHSQPVIYNVTMIGNGHIIPKADNTGPAAIQAKELTGGEIYNSVFANFRSGLHLANARSTVAKGGDAYDQWTNNAANPYLVANGGKAQYQALKVKNNTFINCGDKTAFGNQKSYPITTGAMVSGKNPALYKNFTAVTAADTAQFFTTDGNVAIASLPGIDWTIGFSADFSTLTNPYHATPLNNLTSTITAPADGFFSPVSYRGAFDASKKDNWLSGWAQMQVQSLQNSNPTDLNGDGITDINDFIIFSGRFGFASN